MQWSKVKNIIILILVVVNVLLLGQTAGQERQSQKYRQEALEGAIEVLRQQGYEVDAQNLPHQRNLFSMTMEREKESEEALAQALLGTVSKTEDGIRAVYQGDGGDCWFRSDGSFLFLFLSEQYKLGGEDAKTHAERLLTGAGIACEVIDQEEQAEGHIKVILRQTWDGAPVFSCEIELTYLNGVLTTLEGKRLVGIPVNAEDGESIMDLPTALIRFMAGMREGGHVFTKIKGMIAGYQTTSVGRQMGLTPVWEVETNVDTMLLDGFTGALINR